MTENITESATIGSLGITREQLTRLLAAWDTESADGQEAEQEAEQEAAELAAGIQRGNHGIPLFNGTQSVLDLPTMKPKPSPKPSARKQPQPQPKPKQAISKRRAGSKSATISKRRGSKPEAEAEQEAPEFRVEIFTCEASTETRIRGKFDPALQYPVPGGHASKSASAGQVGIELYSSASQSAIHREVLTAASAFAWSMICPQVRAAVAEVRADYKRKAEAAAIRKAEALLIVQEAEAAEAE